jgi:hypothetical protein
MAEEFAGLDFHSIRLEKQFIRTMETLMESDPQSMMKNSGVKLTRAKMKQPDASIWCSSENRAEAPD